MAQVYLRIYFEAVRFTHYLGIRIKPECWLTGKQRPALSNKELEKGKLPIGALLDNQNINNNLNLKLCGAETEKIYNRYHRTMKNTCFPFM